jgi:polycystin 2
MTAFMVFFIWIKLFNFLDFNYTMTLLSRTLSASVDNILGYLVMFGTMIVFDEQLFSLRNALWSWCWG